MKTYNSLEKKQRAIKRLAEIFYDHWEEGRVGSTRIFEHIIPDEWLIRGQSLSKGTYREHTVPCVLIRDQCIAMYRDNKTIDDVARMIERNLAIILISTEERKKIDHELGLKTTMPKDWCFFSGDPFARIILAGINFTQTPQ